MSIRSMKRSASSFWVSVVKVFFLCFASASAGAYSYVSCAKERWIVSGGLLTFCSCSCSFHHSVSPCLSLSLTSEAVLSRAWRDCWRLRSLSLCLRFLLGSPLTRAGERLGVGDVWMVSVFVFWVCTASAGGAAEVVP